MDVMDELSPSLATSSECSTSSYALFLSSILLPNTRRHRLVQTLTCILNPTQVLLEAQNEPTRMMNVHLIISLHPCSLIRDPMALSALVVFHPCCPSLIFACFPSCHHLLTACSVIAMAICRVGFLQWSSVMLCVSYRTWDVSVCVSRRVKGVGVLSPVVCICLG